MTLTPETWTDRCVRFNPHPRTSDEKWEALFEALPDHYWGRPDWVCRWLEPSISSCNREISVSGLPWWMPKWWARRTVVKIALAHDVGGEAVYVVERVSLP